VFKKWRYPVALVAAAGIGFPTLAMAASTTTGGTGSDGQTASTSVQTVKQPAKPHRRHKRHRQRFAHLPGGVSRGTLNAIADCESGGDPHAVSSGGTYRGKYQFDYGTWASVGGHGDPAAASEREQDYRAALLYKRSGTSPWPVCA
jgi:soluble lytic murein transglycosylase-like protein